MPPPIFVAAYVVAAALIARSAGKAVARTYHRIVPREDHHQ